MSEHIHDETCDIDWDAVTERRLDGEGGSHLPECPSALWTGGPTRPDCYCHALRACEARVREEYAMEWQSEQEEVHVLGLNLAYGKGLDAARDAVPHEISCWGSDTEPCDCFRPSVLAAIDALREES